MNYLFKGKALIFIMFWLVSSLSFADDLRFDRSQINEHAFKRWQAKIKAKTVMPIDDVKIDESYLENVYVKAAEDNSILQWRRFEQGRDLKLGVAETQINSGDTIDHLLFNNNIRADKNAYSVVYKINPNLMDVHQLTVGETVNIPNIEWLSNDTAKPNVFAVLSNYEVRRELSNNAVELDLLQKQMEQQGNVAIPDSVKLLLNEYTENLIGLQQNQLVPEFVQNEFAVESNLINRLLGDLLGGNRAISMGEFELALGSFMKKAKAANDGNSEHVMLEVYTEVENKEFVDGWTIRYAPGYFRNIASEHLEFFNPSTPTKQSVSVGDWVIWATKSGKSNSADKLIKKEQLIAGNTYKLTLMVRD